MLYANLFTLLSTLPSSFFQLSFTFPLNSCLLLYLFSFSSHLPSFLSPSIIPISPFSFLLSLLAFFLSNLSPLFLIFFLFVCSFFYLSYSPFFPSHLPLLSPLYSVLYVLANLEADPQIFFDPNILSDDGTVALTTRSFSEDGELFAYALSESGSDWNMIKVRTCGFRESEREREK